MQTDYKNINSFEVAAVFAIVIGFLLVGLILFSGLTPNKQVAVASSFAIFDLHDESVASVETIKFIYSIPDEFYKEFYIAFTEVATLQEEVIETQVNVASELYRNIASAIANLSEQAASGYAKQNFQTRSQVATAYEGQVLGAAIDLSYKISAINEDLFIDAQINEPEIEQPNTRVEPAMKKQINFYYKYEAPEFNINAISVRSIR